MSHAQCFYFERDRFWWDTCRPGHVRACVRARRHPQQRMATERVKGPRAKQLMDGAGRGGRLGAASLKSTLQLFDIRGAGPSAGGSSSRVELSCGCFSTPELWTHARQTGASRRPISSGKICKLCKSGPKCARRGRTWRSTKTHRLFFLFSTFLQKESSISAPLRLENSLEQSWSSPEPKSKPIGGGEDPRTPRRDGGAASPEEQRAAVTCVQLADGDEDSPEAQSSLLLLIYPPGSDPHADATQAHLRRNLYLHSPN